MRTIFKRVLGVLLSASLLVSVASPTLTAFAQDVPAEEPEQVSQVTPMDPVLLEQRETELAVQAYESLTDEGQAYFERAIASYPELVEFHQSHVDPDYDPSQVASTLNNNDPVSILMAEIALLGLPAAVVYAIEATGTSMVISAAEGPLIVGKILLAASAAALVATCVANWSVVASKWDDIVLAFQHAFSSVVDNVIAACQQLWADAVTAYYGTNAVAVNRGNRTITFNGTTYSCTTRAEQAVNNLNYSQYYPAIRGNDNMVYICPAPISKQVAKLLVYFGDAGGVVFVKSQSQAYALARSLTSNIRGPEYHWTSNNQPGFWRHYHADGVNTHSHIWFNSKLMV